MAGEPSKMRTWLVSSNTHLDCYVMMCWPSLQCFVLSWAYVAEC